MNILIVDDEEVLRDMTVDILGAIRDKHPSLPELHIHTAENGAIGAQKALDHEIDLVITDYMMPRMDGLRMAHALRKRGFTAIIVMVTSACFETSTQAAAVGIDQIHPKPLTYHLLEDIILWFRQKMLEVGSLGENGTEIINEIKVGDGDDEKTNVI
ncbi:hypothetical protein LCGC14_0317850 [marine sediment metagenome]|uniref:Response regulatory domain-containing protein n=1 Tax=marine sediment metagenome TaxID=412755 RepID=A0A0F9W779_9ZZZZ